MAEPVVADTSILIDVLRSDPKALEWWDDLETVPFCSEVTRTEVLRGVRSSDRDTTERLLQTLNWVVVDEEISRTAGALGRVHRRSHPGIDVADLIVAATAERWGAALATTNLKHFPMFEGLRAPYDE